MSKYTEDDLKIELENKEYEYGFYTELDSETFPIGLNEEIDFAFLGQKKFCSTLLLIGNRVRLQSPYPGTLS